MLRRIPPSRGDVLLGSIFVAAVVCAFDATLVGACSGDTPSTAAVSEEAASDGTADAILDGTSTSCSTMEGHPFEEGAACFENETMLIGLCRIDQNPTGLGEEDVCVVDSTGVLYLVTVDDISYLYGDGWTIGPRYNPAGIGASEVPLSAADLTRCNDAQALNEDSGERYPICSADAGNEQ